LNASGSLATLVLLSGALVLAIAAQTTPSTADDLRPGAPAEQARLTGYAPTPTALSRQAVSLGASPAAMTSALRALAGRADRIERRDVMAIVDFSMRSDRARLFILDFRTGTVRSFLVAHGRGSDADHDGWLDGVSDVPGSLASTVGAFRVAEAYHGQHGLSIRLDGLDPGNANARERAIVLHSAPYVSADMARSEGRIGRSFGCFVVEPAHIEEVVGLLAGGTLLYAHLGPPRVGGANGN